MCEVLRMDDRSSAQLFDQLWIVSTKSDDDDLMKSYLLQSLVVNKAGSIFRDIQLPFLNMLAELPNGDIVR
jgi:hypothetical protein